MRSTGADCGSAENSSPLFFGLDHVGAAGILHLATHVLILGLGGRGLPITALILAIAASTQARSAGVSGDLLMARSYTGRRSK